MNSDNKNNKIFVTGATGNVGKALVRLLNLKNVPFLAASPNSGGISDVNTLRFDFLQKDTFKFSGFDRVFLMRPPQISNIQRDMVPALKWFKDIGVKHIVLMSVLGADKSSWIPHRKLEIEIINLGFDYTILRPSFFMQNLTGVHATEIKKENQVFVPAGPIGMSFIDASDIAEVAFYIFMNPKSHIGQTYTLTGPEVLTYKQVASILSRELGRTIVYTSPSTIGFALKMRRRGMSWPHILVMIGLYVASRLNPPNNISPDFKLITGREATQFVDFAARERKVWEK